MADYTSIAGGAPTESAVLVNCDQESIVGDGSIQKPLKAVSGGAPLSLPTGSACLVGGAATIAVSGGVAKLVPTPSSLAAAERVTGIAIAIDGGNTVVQTDGVVDLPIADWDAVIDGGSSTGLTPGAPYYASIATAGNIRALAPTTTGSYATFIGWATSTTHLQLQIGTPVGPHA